MTQSHYDKQSRYLKLLQESLNRGEISKDGVANMLRLIGFSDSMATLRSNEWSSCSLVVSPESKTAMTKRLNEMASLKRYFFMKRFGKNWHRQRYVMLLSESSLRKEMPKDAVTNALKSIGITGDEFIDVISLWIDNGLGCQTGTECEVEKEQRLKEIETLKRYLTKKGRG